MTIHLLGLYTARVELFKFFFVLFIGLLIWSIYNFIRYSGSLSKKKKKRRALFLIILFSVIVIFMSISWLASKTNYGWWFERF